jgi:hypothetical protein
MARGGKREGAGRKPGAPNKATQEQREAIKESGLTPLDYLLSVMRDENAEQAERVDAANKAAPYVHAKLSSVDHKSSDRSMTPQVAVYELPDNGRGD